MNSVLFTSQHTCFILWKLHSWTLLYKCCSLRKLLFPLGRSEIRNQPSKWCHIEKHNKFSALKPNCGMHLDTGVTTLSLWMLGNNFEATPVSGSGGTQSLGSFCTCIPGRHYYHQGLWDGVDPSPGVTICLWKWNPCVHHFKWWHKRSSIQGLAIQFDWMWLIR